MIDSAQRMLVNNLVTSDVFQILVEEIRKEQYKEWLDADTPEDREKIYSETRALDRVIETLVEKASQLSSGDT